MYGYGSLGYGGYSTTTKPSYLTSPLSSYSRVPSLSRSIYTPYQDLTSWQTTKSLFSPQRPIRMDTADIDVSGPRKTSLGTSTAGAIQRGRSVVRLESRREKGKSPGAALVEKFTIKEKKLSPKFTPYFEEEKKQHVFRTKPKDEYPDECKVVLEEPDGRERRLDLDQETVNKNLHQEDEDTLSDSDSHSKSKQRPIKKVVKRPQGFTVRESLNVLQESEEENVESDEPQTPEPKKDDEPVIDTEVVFSFKKKKKPVAETKPEPEEESVTEICIMLDSIGNGKKSDNSAADIPHDNTGDKVESKIIEEIKEPTKDNEENPAEKITKEKSKVKVRKSEKPKTQSTDNKEQLEQTQMKNDDKINKQDKSSEISEKQSDTEVESKKKNLIKKKLELNSRKTGRQETDEKTREIKLESVATNSASLLAKPNSKSLSNEINNAQSNSINQTNANCNIILDNTKNNQESHLITNETPFKTEINSINLPPDKKEQENPQLNRTKYNENVEDNGKAIKEVCISEKELSNHDKTCENYQIQTFKDDKVEVNDNVNSDVSLDKNDKRNALPDKDKSNISADIKSLSPDKDKSNISTDNKIKGLSPDKDKSNISTDNKIKKLSPDKDKSNISTDNKIKGLSPDKDKSNISTDNKIKKLSPDKDKSNISTDNKIKGLSPDKDKSNISTDNKIKGLSSDKDKSNISTDSKIKGLSPDKDKSIISPDSNIKSLSLDKDKSNISVDNKMKSLSPDKDKSNISVDNKMKSLSPDKDKSNISVDNKMKSLSPDKDKSNISVDNKIKSLSADKDKSIISVDNNDKGKTEIRNNKISILGDKVKNITVKAENSDAFVENNDEKVISPNSDCGRIKDNNDTNYNYKEINNELANTLTISNADNYDKGEYVKIQENNDSKHNDNNKTDNGLSLKVHGVESCLMNEVIYDKENDKPMLFKDVVDKRETSETSAINIVGKTVGGDPGGKLASLSNDVPTGCDPTGSQCSARDPNGEIGRNSRRDGNKKLNHQINNCPVNRETIDKLKQTDITQSFNSNKVDNFNTEQPQTDKFNNKVNHTTITASKKLQSTLELHKTKDKDKPTDNQVIEISSSSLTNQSNNVSNDSELVTNSSKDHKDENKSVCSKVLTKLPVASKKDQNPATILKDKQKLPIESKHQIEKVPFKVDGKSSTVQIPAGSSKDVSKLKNDQIPEAVTKIVPKSPKGPKDEKHPVVTKVVPNLQNVAVASTKVDPNLPKDPSSAVHTKLVPKFIEPEDRIPANSTEVSHISEKELTIDNTGLLSDFHLKVDDNNLIAKSGEIKRHASKRKASVVDELEVPSLSERRISITDEVLVAEAKHFDSMIQKEMAGQRRKSSLGIPKMPELVKTVKKKPLFGIDRTNRRVIKRKTKKIDDLSSNEVNNNNLVQKDVEKNNDLNSDNRILIKPTSSKTRPEPILHKTNIKPELNREQPEKISNEIKTDISFKPSIKAEESSSESQDATSSEDEECDVNCHRKCEKLMPHLCGVNQKLVVEALAIAKKTRKGESVSTSLTTLPELSILSHKDSTESYESSSETTGSSSSETPGRFTPPATTIPRFRKYAIEDFQFLKVLGKGSFGKVLLAELKGSEYYYAVKCLKKDVVLEDDDVECTMIERKVLALGTGHPYLCHLFCTFQTESHLFFVMEYLNGGDLMFHIQHEGRFDEGRARFYAAEIVSGLKFLHKKGIIYRDLKLDNVLLDYEGHIRIADFGMCKLQIYLDKTADTFCGTPDYMAPEIIKGQKYNQCVDWWSFGILLYEMLVGQSPFSGCDEDDLFWSICNERPHVPKYISAEGKHLLLALLEKEWNKRLGSSENGVNDVMDHEFFRGLRWNLLERRQLDPPFKPRMSHPLDTKYFDKAFTSERPRLTPIDKSILASMDQIQFNGFSYTNPNATE